jgi:hypothetical protein
MNLHGLVRGAINAVNPDTAATLKQSSGNTVDAAGNQVPGYSSLGVTIQVQPLSTGQLAHTDFLGIQGVLRAVYLFGLARGVVRPLQIGGDLLSFDSGMGLQTWLVVAVDEQWPDWARATVVLQQ